MRHIAAARAELGVRTIFNLLGPLSNPAGVRRLLVGVFSPAWLEPLALTLGALGATRAWLVHGSDGLDEITTTGPTSVVAFEEGETRAFTLRPEDHGLRRATLAELRGGDPAHNARALRAMLGGERGAYRDIAALNAAAALVVAGRAGDVTAGLRLAGEAIDGGAAARVLDRLIQLSNGGTLAAAV